jgi:hypothetical protein
VMDQGGDVSATRVGVGDRGRGLFASRDVEAGEVVLRVPIECALNDGRAEPPYPGAPWSVVLAAELLRERAKGDDARLSRYVRSLPSETIGFANSSFASREGAADLLADDAAFDELERYDFLLRGSAAAVQKHHAFEDWRWAMSLAHSRTFRVEEPAPSGDAKKTLGATRRLMVPYVDLLNHDSRETEVQCEWSCVWDLGGGGGDFVVKATRDVRQGEELVTSYGERDDRHFFLFFGFLPEPNPHNGVALFRGMEEAAAWYEALCGDGEETRDAWASARREAVATVRAETEKPGADRPDEGGRRGGGGGGASHGRGRGGGRTSAPPVRDPLRRSGRRRCGRPRPRAAPARRHASRGGARRRGVVRGGLGRGGGDARARLRRRVPTQTPRPVRGDRVVSFL